MVAKKVWFEGERIYIETDDGRTLWQSILYYQRLRNATKEQREDYELGAGIHWKRLTRMFLGESFEYDDPEPAGISRLFLTHPRYKRFGCCPTDGDAAEFVGTVYTGIKRPLQEREQAILNTVREIGKRN